MRKKVSIEFEQVRDCPYWCSGECIHPDCPGAKKCFESEVFSAPIYCPLPNPEGCGTQPTIDNTGSLKLLCELEECVKLLGVNLEYNRGTVTEKLNAVIAQLKASRPGAGA